MNGVVFGIGVSALRGRVMEGEMSELYPDDATLLALSEDTLTGVEYIPTGRSPYYLEFRKMLYRLLRAAERANDLRVYRDGELSIGVRPGRALVTGGVVDFEGATELAVEPGATSDVWLDGDGVVQIDTAGLPAERSTFVPLARVVAGGSAIESVTDLRGEAFLSIPSLAVMAVEATAGEINQALSGISANVTATALSVLTGGGSSSADAYHRHLGLQQDEPNEVSFRIVNQSDDANANAALQLRLPQVQAADSVLSINRDNGFLQQRYDDVSYNLVGTAQVQHAHAGELLTSVSGALAGVVPADGEVIGVVLSMGGNLESDDGDDGVSAVVKINGSSVTDTAAALSAGDGSGFVSTARGDGTAATLVSDGTEQVKRGDIVSVDLTRTVNGQVSSEAEDVAVLVVIRVDGPA